jgi:hypothetical protein
MANKFGEAALIYFPSIDFDFKAIVLVGKDYCFLFYYLGVPVILPFFHQELAVLF